MDYGIRGFLEDRNVEDFIGKTSVDVYNEYLDFCKDYMIEGCSYRRFAVVFPSMTGLTTTSNYTRNGNVRVYVARVNNAYDEGFDEFTGEKDSAMFEDADNNAIYRAYTEKCKRLGYPTLGLYEFSRRLCSRYDLTTKSVYRDGVYVRVYKCEE